MPVDSLDRHAGAVVAGCNGMKSVELTIIRASRRTYAVLDTCASHDLDRIVRIIDSAAGRLQWAAPQLAPAVS